MTYKEKREKFLKDFKIKYPEFKIIKFTKLSDEIIVEDKDGFRYTNSRALQVLISTLSVESVINKKEFIEFKLKKIFPDLRVIEYNGMKNPILIEDKDGFRYSPQCYDLFKKHPVSIQTCTEKYKLFVFKANKKHNNLYTYPEFDYKNGKQIINIDCPLHGQFSQRIEDHLYGNGCKQCGSVGFSKESWLKKVKNKTPIFYVLRFFNNKEEFIKIGITSTSIPNRYRRLKSYTFEVITIKTGTASEIYDIEKRILRECREYKYIPKIKFKGHSECLNLISIENILQICCA